MLDGRAVVSAGVVSDSVTGATSFRVSWRARVFNGMWRRSGDSNSSHPVKGIDCRPEEENVPRGSRSSRRGTCQHVLAREDGRSFKTSQVHRDRL